MYEAFPRADYYDGSVAMSLSAGRRSRIYARETLSAFRLPIPLNQFITGRSS